MVRKTKALWLDLETQIRWTGGARKPNKTFVRANERFWASLGAEKGRRFVDAIEEYDRHSHAALPVFQVAAAAQREVNAIAVNARTEWKQYIRRQEQVEKEWAKALNAHNRYTTALLALSTAVTQFGTLDPNNPTLAHPAVLQWLADQVTDAGNRLTAVQNHLATARRRANTPPVPGQRQDGKLKMHEETVPEQVKDNRKVRCTAQFKQGQPAKSLARPAWQGAWLFGKGAMADAGLWVLLGANGNVVDRMVRKDTFWQAFEWGLVSKWYGDLRDLNNREPYEIKCHRSLDGAQSGLRDYSLNHLAVNIPGLRYYHIDDTRLLYSMSMEFCPFKSLADLIDDHRSDPNNPIPEPFVWPSAQPPADRPPRSQALQRVLAHSTPGFFASYPTPKLSDFGLAFMTSNGDKLNPTVYADGSGTDGYTAPEQDSFVSLPDMDPIDRFRLLGHTNVYGVGMIIFSMAAATKSPQQPNFLGSGEEERDYNDAMAIPLYGNHLKQLIRDCIRFKPCDRPAWNQVLDRIDQAMDAKGLNLAYGMRNSPSVPQTHGSFLHNVPRDAYAVRLSGQALPAM